MFFFGKKKDKPKEAAPVGNGGVKHIAFIMDGNGRWAQKKGLPREAGHAEGAKTFDRTVRACIERGIDVVTVYAFSTENWSRPKAEVDAIMALLSKYLDYAEKKRDEFGTRMIFLGDKSRLAPELREKAERLEAETADRTRILNIALNYGARDELTRAFRALAEEGKSDITEEDITQHLYTALSPDPDLIVRTGGDLRVSNFLLWQSAYSEFYFTKTLWPDFSAKELDAALADFAGRHRRYGGV